MSPSSSSPSSGGSGMDSNTKLIVTAIGAALTGAAMAIAAMKLTQSSSSPSSSQQQQQQQQQQRQQEQESNVVSPSGGRQKVSSIIYEPTLDASTCVTSGCLSAGCDNTTVIFPHMHEEKVLRRISNRVIIEEENVIPRQSVTVRVSATSANMGPGCKYL